MQGRDFDGRDVSAHPLVMAVNETFARRIRADGGDPLQARFTVLGKIRQVVAVVGDVKHQSLDAGPGREVYIPIGQAPVFFQSYDLVVRADDALSLVPSVRAAIWAVDRNQALGTPVLLEDYIDRTLRPRRLLTGLVSAFAGSALLLAACGVYGMVGYRVAQRMKEVAIRVALGASGRQVVTTVLRETFVYLGLGLAAGLLLASAAAFSIRPHLFGMAAGPDDGRHGVRGGDPRGAGRGVCSGTARVAGRSDGRASRRIPTRAACGLRPRFRGSYGTISLL